METPRTERDSDRDFIAGLGKGLAVIECFDDDRARLTIAAVASMTGMSRAAARRCLLTLQRLGYADFDGKFYFLTPRILRLGFAYLAASELPQIIQPFLERLSEQIDESCSATTLDGSDIVYIARSGKRRIMALDLGVGSRLPAYCTSMGRVLLAARDRDVAERCIQASELHKFTPHTRTRPDELMEILSEVREQGYSIVDQELEIGLVSIAVPVIDASGITVAAINTSAQRGRVPPAEVAKRFLPKLLEAQAHLRPLIKRSPPATF